MNSLIDTFKNDSSVKRFVVLRQFILKNQKCYEELKNKLSRNRAECMEMKYEIIIDEYLDLRQQLKNDLQIIKSILENGINEDFNE